MFLWSRSEQAVSALALFCAVEDAKEAGQESLPLLTRSLDPLSLLPSIF